MGRSILAVIVGYLAMAIFVMVTFIAAYFVLKADGAFQAGSYEPSGTWIAASLVLGSIAAVLGGFVCMRIAPRTGPLYSLATLVLVLGLATAPLSSGRDDPGPRTGDVGNFEAMQNARQPTWMLIANPIIGAVGVLLGGRRGARAKARPDASV